MRPITALTRRRLMATAGAATVAAGLPRGAAGMAPAPRVVRMVFDVPSRGSVSPAPPVLRPAP